MGYQHMARRIKPLAVAAAAVISSAAIVAATPSPMAGGDEAYTPTKLSTAKYELTAISDITINGIIDAYWNGTGGYVGSYNYAEGEYFDPDKIYAPAVKDGQLVPPYEADPYYGNSFFNGAVEVRDPETGSLIGYKYNQNPAAVYGASGALYYLESNVLESLLPGFDLDRYYFEMPGLPAVLYVGASEYFGPAAGQAVAALQTLPYQVTQAFVGATEGLPTFYVGPVKLGGGILSNLYFNGATPDGSYNWSYPNPGGLPAIWGYLSESLNSGVSAAALAASSTGGGAIPTLFKLPAANATGDPISSFIGFFVGNGANAAADCTGAACNGGNGGLFWGNGGNGANGGRGGNAGFLFGNGGNGGNGVDASGTTDDNYVAAVAGGNGGNAGLLFGNGGKGGNGGADNTDIPGTSVGADGGAGGKAGLLIGNGGAGGNGGAASAPTKGSAEGGYGGNGGTAGIVGAGGAGGNGGNAEATSDDADDYAAGGYAGNGGAATVGNAGKGGVGGDGVGHGKASGYAGPGGNGGQATVGQGGAGGSGGNGSAQEGDSAGAYGGDGGNVITGTGGAGGKGGNSTKPADSTTGINVGGDGGHGGSGVISSRGGNGASGGNAVGGGKAGTGKAPNPAGGFGGGAGSGGVGGTSGTAGQNGTPDPTPSGSAAASAEKSAASTTSNGSAKKAGAGRHRAS